MANCSVSHWPAAFQFEILMTTFVELRVVAGRSRNCSGRPQAVSRRPILIHRCHAVPTPRPCRAVLWPWEVAFRTARSEHGRGAPWTLHGTCELAWRRNADRLHPSLNTTVAQSKNCKFGVNTTIQLKNMTATSDSYGIWRGMFQLTNLPVLSRVVLIFFILIVV